MSANAIAPGVEEIDVPERRRLLFLHELPAASSRDYAVKGVLPKPGIAALVGPSGSAKSFLAWDMARHIATGQRWQGHRVRRGLIVYVAAEGSHGLSMRRDAMAARHPEILRAPFTTLPEAINLLVNDEIDELVQMIREASGEAGEAPALVIFDTLHRSMAGGDENSAVDMGRALDGAASVVRAFDTAVLIVHHTGKDAGRGGRGSNSLPAAVDAEITVEGIDNPRVLTITKNRDGARGERIGFRLEVVPLGRDDDGDEISSCVVTYDDSPPPLANKLGKHAQSLLAGLREWAREHPDTTHISSVDLIAVCKAQKIGRQRKAEAVAALTAAGYLTPATGGHCLVL